MFCSEKKNFLREIIGELIVYNRFFDDSFDFICQEDFMLPLLEQRKREKKDFCLTFEKYGNVFPVFRNA